MQDHIVDNVVGCQCFSALSDIVSTHQLSNRCIYGSWSDAVCLKEKYKTQREREKSIYIISTPDFFFSNQKRDDEQFPKNVPSCLTTAPPTAICQGPCGGCCFATL